MGRSGLGAALGNTPADLATSALKASVVRIGPDASAGKVTPKWFLNHRHCAAGCWRPVICMRDSGFSLIVLYGAPYKQNRFLVDASFGKTNIAFIVTKIQLELIMKKPSNMAIIHWLLIIFTMGVSNINVTIPVHIYLPSDGGTITPPKTTMVAPHRSGKPFPSQYRQ